MQFFLFCSSAIHEIYVRFRCLYDKQSKNHTWLRMKDFDILDAIKQNNPFGFGNPMNTSNFIKVISYNIKQDNYRINWK